MPENTLLWSFALCSFGLFLLTLLLLLRFADVGAIRSRLRSMLPGHRFESRYLRAIVSRLGNTPALMVISSGSADMSRHNLNLLEAFSPLTLRADRDAPAAATRPTDEDLLEEMMRPVSPHRETRELRPRSSRRRLLYNADRDAPAAATRPTDEDLLEEMMRPVSPHRETRELRPRFSRPRLLYNLLWLLTQSLLFTGTLALLTWLLWSHRTEPLWTWFRMVYSLMMVILWALSCDLVEERLDRAINNAINNLISSVIPRSRETRKLQGVSSRIDEVLRRHGRSRSHSFGDLMMSVLHFIAIIAILILYTWLLLFPIAGPWPAWPIAAGGLAVVGICFLVFRWLDSQLLKRRQLWGVRSKIDQVLRNRRIWLFWLPTLQFQITWLFSLAGLLLVAGWYLLAHWLHILLATLYDWWEEQQQCSATPGTPGAEIWAHPHLLIQGDPGSGKTTLLRHMAVICANERLGVARFWQHNRVRDAYGWPAAPFPIYLPLRALSAVGSQTSNPLLMTYASLLTTLFSPELDNCPPDFFMRKLQQGGCLVLLDAFDELPDPDTRTRLARLISDLPSGPPRNPNRIVVTSRIVGYEGQLDGTTFVRRWVNDLDDDQVENFITARYTAMALAERRALGLPTDQALSWSPEQRARNLMRRLPEHPGLRRLRRNPLLLALMVVVHHYQRSSGQELPQERYRLYEKALELLVQDWEKRKRVELDLPDANQQDEANDRNLDQKLRLLRELAWQMFVRVPALADPAPADRKPHAVITGREAQAILARVLEDIPTFAPDLTDAARSTHCRSEAANWLHNLGQRGGVLQELGNVPHSSDKQIQFAHLTFQEYLAARAAASEQQSARQEQLLAECDNATWREVLLLYAASHDATPVIEHVLARAEPAHVLLAGTVLLERPIKLDQACQAQTLEHLRRLALHSAHVDEPTAMKALQIIEQAAALPERTDLLHAATSAPHSAVRTRILELLAGSRPNRPADEPADPDLKAVALQVLAQESDYRPRLAAGFALARHDPRYDGDGWIPELVEIPAGPFLMSSDDADELARRDEKLQHRVDLPAYAIGKTPVTNAQWRRFMEVGGYTTRRYWTRAGWHFINRVDDDDFDQTWLQRFIRRFQWWHSTRDQSEPITTPAYWDDSDYDGDNQPVVGISWYEAVAYCRWLSEATGHVFTLPTEAEWEKAARGPHGLIYPWGNTWEPGRCNAEETDVGRSSPVGSFPAGASPYGVLDMAGNVREWCATKWGKTYPYHVAEEWDDGYLEGTDGRVFRGGSWGASQKVVRGASRNFYNPRNRYYYVGMRVARRSPQLCRDE